MSEDINHDRRRFLGPAVMTIGVIGAAVALYALTAMAQSARDIHGPAPVVLLASAPAPRMAIAPPLAAPLAHGRVGIQYRAEYLRIVPVCGPHALDVSPRIGHLHVTVDATRWHWAEASGEPQFMTSIDGVDFHFIHVRSPAL